MKTGLLAGACLCALLLPFPTFAQSQQAPRPLLGGHGEDPVSFVALYDLDNDGKVTPQEFEQFRRKRYAETDADGDGSVDLNEYTQEYSVRQDRELDAAREREAGQTHARFTALDANKDGFVDKAEYAASGEKIFAGYLKLKQQPQAKPELAGAPPAGAQDGKRPGPPRAMLGMPTTHSLDGLLALYDGNGDGKLDRAEFDKARAEAFARTDRNGDGKLDEDEYTAEYEQRLERNLALRRQGGLDQAKVRFDILDKDKDGRMSWDEYAASGKNLFERSDRDHNGVVDAADARLPAPKMPDFSRDDHAQSKQ